SDLATSCGSSRRHLISSAISARSARSRRISSSTTAISCTCSTSSPRRAIAACALRLARSSSCTTAGAGCRGRTACGGREMSSCRRSCGRRRLRPMMLHYENVFRAHVAPPGGPEMRMVAALYVESDGVYAGLPDVDLWDEKRDARKYPGDYPVVAHPPCSRWCRLAGLIQARWGHKKGDDGGTFAAALESV